MGLLYTEWSTIPRYLERIYEAECQPELNVSSL